MNDISYVPRLAQSSADVQWTTTTTFLTQEYHRSGPKSLDDGRPGQELWVLVWAKRPNLCAAHAPRACRVRYSPKGPKLGFEYLPTYKTLHCVHGIPLVYIVVVQLVQSAAKAFHSHQLKLLNNMICYTWLGKGCCYHRRSGLDSLPSSPTLPTSQGKG